MDISQLAHQLHRVVRKRNEMQTSPFDGVVRSFQLVLSQKSSLLQRNESLEKELESRTSAATTSSVSVASSLSSGSSQGGSARSDAEFRALENKMHGLQEQLTAKWKEVSELTRAQLTMTRAVADANKTQQEAQASAEEWRATLKKCQNSLTSVKEKLAEKESECNALRTELQKVRDMLEKSEKHLCGLTAENEGLVSRMIEDKVSMMDEVNKMTASCDKMKATIAALQEENKRLKASQSDTKADSEELSRSRQSSGIWAAITGTGAGRSRSKSPTATDDLVADKAGWISGRTSILPSDTTMCIKAHDAEVNDIAFVGNCVATASGDGTVKVWDARSASLRSSYHVGGAVLCIDGEKGMLVAGTTSSQAIVYQVATERQKHILSGHKGKVVGVHMSPDGRSVATVGTDRCMKLFDMASGRCTRTLACPSACTSVTFTMEGSTIISGHQDSGVRLWDVRAGAMTQEVKNIHRAAVTSVKVAPHGSGSLRILSMSRDNTLRMLDGRSYMEVQVFKESGFRVGWNYSACSFSGDGSYVVAPSADGRILFWDSLTGKLVRQFNAHERSAVSCAWSRKGIVGSVDNAGYMALYR
eukprot:g4219.t1